MDPGSNNNYNIRNIRGGWVGEIKKASYSDALEEREKEVMEDHSKFGNVWKNDICNHISWSTT